MNKLWMIVIVLALMVGCEEEPTEHYVRPWTKTHLARIKLVSFKKVTEQFDEETPHAVITLGVRDDKLFVEGDLDEGAKLFFEEIVKPMADEYIREHCEPNEPAEPNTMVICLIQKRACGHAWVEYSVPNPFIFTIDEVSKKFAHEEFKRRLGFVEPNGFSITDANRVNFPYWTASCVGDYAER